MSYTRYVKSRILWMAILIAFFLMVAFIIGNNVKSSTVTAAASYITGSVRRGEIEALLSVPGKLDAINEVDLSFQQSGIISTVVVRAGDIVQQGQPLARLDSRELELTLSASQAALKQAQAKLETIRTGSAKELATAQANLRQAQTKLQLARTGNVTPEDLQSAQAAVDQAQARYNNLLSKPNQKDIQEAEAALRQAQAKLDQAKSVTFAQAIKQAEARLESANQNLKSVTSNTNTARDQAKITQDQAQKSYDSAKANYDKIYAQNHNSDGSLKPGVTQPALDAENNAKLGLDDAEVYLNRTKLDYTNAQTQAEAAQNEAKADVAEAQANLEQVKANEQLQQKQVTISQAEVDRAQAALDKSRQGATKDELDAGLAEITGAKARLAKLNNTTVNQKDVALAQVDVDKAQSDLDNLSKGPSANELGAAQAAVEEADAVNKRAMLRLEQAVLVAPFNGQVGQVKLVQGQNVTANAAVMTLLDLSALKVQVTIPESEIGRVKPGQTARLAMEVVPNLQDLRGRISDIAVKPSQLPNGVVGYGVTILLNRPFNSNNDLLAQGVRPGMTSNVRLIVDQKSDVLLIPRRSIRTIVGNNVVDVLTGSGQLVTTPVTLGIIGEKDVEVLEPSLLLPGDQIVLNSSIVSVFQTPEAKPEPTSSGT